MSVSSPPSGAGVLSCAHMWAQCGGGVTGPPGRQSSSGGAAGWPHAHMPCGPVRAALPCLSCCVPSATRTHTSARNHKGAQRPQVPDRCMGVCAAPSRSPVTRKRKSSRFCTPRNCAARSSSRPASTRSARRAARCASIRSYTSCMHMCTRKHRHLMCWGCASQASQAVALPQAARRLCTCGAAGSRRVTPAAAAPPAG